MSLTSSKFSRIGTESEIEERRRRTLAYLRHVEEPQDIELTPDELRYMRAIRVYPDMRAIKRDGVLGVRGGAGGRTRKKLDSEPFKLLRSLLLQPAWIGSS